MHSRLSEFAKVDFYFEPRCKTFSSYIVAHKESHRKFLMTEYHLDMFNMPQKILRERLLFLLQNYKLFRCEGVFFQNHLPSLAILKTKIIGKYIKTFYVVEPLPIITLADYATKNTITKKFLFNNVTGLFNTLSACHAANILYSNLSPFSIIFDETFSLRPPPLDPFTSPKSMIAPPPLTLRNTFRSINETRFYRAPEWNSEEQFLSSDTWSLASILVEYLIFGGPVFGALTDQDQAIRTQLILGKAPDFLNWPTPKNIQPCELPDIFLEMFNYDPQQRPILCVHFCERILTYIRGEKSKHEDNLEDKIQYNNLDYPANRKDVHRRHQKENGLNSNHKHHSHPSDRNQKNRGRSPSPTFQDTKYEEKNKNQYPSKVSNSPISKDRPKSSHQQSEQYNPKSETMQRKNSPSPNHISSVNGIKDNQHGSNHSPRHQNPNSPSNQKDLHLSPKDGKKIVRISSDNTNSQSTITTSTTGTSNLSVEDNDTGPSVHSLPTPIPSSSTEKSSDNTPNVSSQNENSLTDKTPVDSQYSSPQRSTPQPSSVIYSSSTETPIISSSSPKSKQQKGKESSSPIDKSFNSSNSVSNRPITEKPNTQKRNQRNANHTKQDYSFTSSPPFSSYGEESIENNSNQPTYSSVGDTSQEVEDLRHQMDQIKHSFNVSRKEHDDFGSYETYEESSSDSEELNKRLKSIQEIKVQMEQYQEKLNGVCEGCSVGEIVNQNLEDQEHVLQTALDGITSTSSFR